MSSLGGSLDVRAQGARAIFQHHHLEYVVNFRVPTRPGKQTWSTIEMINFLFK